MLHPSKVKNSEKKSRLVSSKRKKRNLSKYINDATRAIYGILKEASQLHANKKKHTEIKYEDAELLLKKLAGDVVQNLKDFFRSMYKRLPKLIFWLHANKKKHTEIKYEDAELLQKKLAGDVVQNLKDIFRSMYKRLPKLILKTFNPTTKDLFLRKMI